MVSQRLTDQTASGTVLELFACDSNREEHFEHWRLLDQRQDSSHFVVSGYGIEDEQDSSDNS
ncbi:MAG: hypothetical protein CMJ80_17825 [Planctomycetaceae bacterium]|nr:hypothetical protein [Planctomycetaceae bacterium]